jgi:hypothetical protein
MHPDDMCFFASNPANILLAQRPAAVLETQPLQVTILIPVTSPIVKRTLKGSHHFHNGLATASPLTLVLVDQETGQNYSIIDTEDDYLVTIINGALTIEPVLSATTQNIVLQDQTSGQNYQIIIDDAALTLEPITGGVLVLSNTAEFAPSGYIRPVSFRGMSAGVVNSTTSTTVALLNAQNWPTSGSFWSSTQRRFYQYASVSGNTLQGVQPSPSSAIAGQTVEYAPMWSYTSIVGNVLQNVYPSPTPLLGLEIAAAGANIYSNWPGSFIFDVGNAPGSVNVPANLAWHAPPPGPGPATFIAGAPATTLGEAIQQGSNRSLIQVADVSDLGASGYVVFEFGTSQQEGPVAFLGTSGSSGLIMDPSHVFTLDHPAGVEVRLVRSLGRYTPQTAGQDLPVYTVSTAPARAMLESYLRSCAAAGITLNYQINVPPQKWPLPVSLYSNDPNSLSL